MQRKFPSYLQLEETDCGATCLKIICKHYGKNIKLDVVRELTNKVRAGVTLLNLSSASEKLGFRARGLRMTIAQLSSSINLPCILHWNRNHFVVLYKINKRGFYISDPAAGLVKLSPESFREHWLSGDQEATGIALELTPTPEFYELETEDHVEVRSAILKSYLTPHRKLISQVFLSLFVSSLIGLFPPFLTQALVDKGINIGNLDFVQIVLIAQLVIMVGQTTIDFIKSWILLHISTRISVSLLSDYLAKLMRLPIRYFDVKNIGDIRQRIDDNRRIQTFLTGSLIGMSFSAVTFVVYSLILAFYEVKLLGIFYLGSLLYVLWILFFLKRRKALDYKRFSTSAANQSNIYQLITSMQDIKLYGIEQQKRWDWERIQAQLFRNSVQSLTLGQHQQAGSFVINQIKNIAISYIAAKSVMTGEMTLGMMMSTQYILGQLNGPITEFISFVQTGQDAKISLERLREVYEKKDEGSEFGNITQIDPDKDLVIKNLSFSYDHLNSPNVLTDVSAKIPRGKVTALVGASGSGKTTVMKLLLRFYPIKDGSISIGDTNLEALDIKFWREQCGSILQDSTIFSDTIAGNIALGQGNVDIVKLNLALKLANIYDFVKSLPLGSQTKIGQEGLNLSPGQKQRILIARVIYREPEFIFFDEATNSLDTGNEREIVKNLQHFFKNRTVIVSAHRLSTIMNADQIIVIDKGQVAETGTHSELVNLKGLYHSFVNNQVLEV